jgi:hypothetical protein
MRRRPECASKNLFKNRLRLEAFNAKIRNRFMTIATKRPRHRGAADAFIDARLATGVVAFPLVDLVEETRLSPTAAKNQLLRLGNWVVKITRKHQFYLIVSPEHRTIGAPPANWWLNDYFKWLGHPYYLALQSAAEAYGSEPQALQVTQVMTDASRREIIVGRLCIRFFLKNTIQQTPTQQLANAYAPLLVSTPEATAVDLVRYASRIGGIERAAETIVPLVPLMKAPGLKQALDAENEPALGQRLGYILESAGHAKLARIVEDWLPAHPLWTPLVPAQVDRETTPTVPRWHLIKNAKLPV